VADPGIWNGGSGLPLLSSPLPCPPVTSPSLSFSLIPSLFSLPLEVGPLNPVRVSGEGCKLP